MGTSMLARCVTALSSVAAVSCANGCAGARPAPTPASVAASSHASTAAAPSDAVAVAAAVPDASVQNAPPDAAVPDGLASSSPPDAGSPLATLFDGDPSDGPVRLGDTRCGPGCLQYPTGWLSTDDAGFVYAWFFVGEGRFGTAEVVRCPVPKLDARSLAMVLLYAGGEKVTWSSPVEGTIGKDHAHALVAEGVGTSHGRKARFWYAYVDVTRRKDLVVAYVVDGEPARRTDETIAIVRSVSLADGKPPAR